MTVIPDEYEYEFPDTGPADPEEALSGDAFRDVDGEVVRGGVRPNRHSRRTARPLKVAGITLPCDLNMEDDLARNPARLPDGMELERGDRVVAGRPGFYSSAVVQQVEEVDGKWFVYVRQLHLLVPGDAGWDEQPHG